MRSNGGGDILVSSSISGYQTIHFEPVYSASKHALNAFLYGVRRQVIQDRIRIDAIAPATVLAPMAGVTDTVFRRMIRAQGGCGLIMTEFTSSHGVVAQARTAKPTRTFRYLHFEPEEHPISAQLFGSDPQVMADAARPDGSSRRLPAVLSGQVQCSYRGSSIFVKNSN